MIRQYLDSGEDWGVRESNERKSERGEAWKVLKIDCRRRFIRKGNR